MVPSEVKKGDRVVFVAGDNHPTDVDLSVGAPEKKEFNGIALSDAKVAVHPGAHRAAIYLDIAYLNEAGAAVKVLSSPVLVATLPDSDLDKIVEVEHAARHKDHRRHTLKSFGGDDDAASIRKEFQDLKQAAGWKPFGDSAEVQALTASLANMTSERDGLKASLDAVMAERYGLKAANEALEAAAQQMAGGQTSGTTAEPQVVVADAQAETDAASSQEAANTQAASDSQPAAS